MAVSVLDDHSLEAKELSEKLRIPLLAEPKEYFLVKVDGMWEVQDSRQGTSFRLCLDLAKDFVAIQRQKVNPKKDLLCRSLGYKADQKLRVLDGTLGMAKDALHLLSCGIVVIGVEKHPLQYFLLNQSLQRGGLGNLEFEILHGDVEEVLEEKGLQVDALYLDPMFENLKQKSAPKKGLAFLREISTNETLSPTCVEKALKLGVKRVVVKRPLKSENLFGKPNHVFEGKMIRYDVYTRL